MLARHGILASVSCTHPACITYSHLCHALDSQHIDGFLKLLFCPNTRKLLGCCAIGESASEIIHIGQVVMSMGGTVEYFRDSVFNYPTMAETYRVAALDGLGRLGIFQ